MTLRLLFFLAIILFSASDSKAQERCGSTQKLDEQLRLNPDLWETRQAIQEFTERWIVEHGSESRAVVTIPVVVHVVYATSAQNISDAQIFSQIDVLNEDYRAMNADISSVPSVWNSLIADCEIEFALAERTPDAVETNGITRTETTVDNWNGSDNVKYTSLGGRDAWPSDKYLNIWVCNIGSQYLGFAYPPGVASDIDGVVIGYKYFGRVGTLSNTYNLGRTTTHEIAHYFNLDHLWGTGPSNPNCNASDNVPDTPMQEGANFNCPTFPSVSCSNGPNGDMFNNYMDYTDDVCMYFFTQGQKARMLAALNGPRVSLLTSDGLTPPVIGIEEVASTNSWQVFPNPTSSQFTIRAEGTITGPVHISLTDLLGQEVKSFSRIELQHADFNMNVSELPAGTYVMTIGTEGQRSAHRINIIK